MSVSRSCSASFVAFVLLALVWGAPGAQAGVFDRDLAFGTGGLAARPADGSGRWKVLVPLPDGRFLAAGQSPTGAAVVVRFSSEGQLDPTWAPAAATPGLAVVPGAGAVVPSSLLALPGGGVLVGATAQNGTATPEVLIARLTADGHLDPGFARDGTLTRRVGVATRLGAIARTATGVIYAAGRDEDISDRGVVLKVSADGVPDGAYAGTGAAAFRISNDSTGFDDLAVEDNGRVTVTGGAEIVTTRRQLVVARLTPAGTLDPAFGGGDGWTSTDLNGITGSSYEVEGRELRLDAAGNALVAATVQSAGGPVSHLVGLARFTAAGALDAGFGSGGTRTQDPSPSHAFDAADLVVLPDGGFVLAGTTRVGSTNQYGLVGYRPDGSADTSLNPTNPTAQNAANLEVGTGGDDKAAAVALTPAGRLLVAGRSLTPSEVDTGAIVRLGGEAHGPTAVVNASWPQSAPGRAVRPGQLVSFDGSASSDPDGPLSTWEWDLDGDGQFDSTGPKVSMTYTQARTVGVLLRVTDPDGLRGSSGTTFLVQANRSPDVHFNAVAEQPTAGKSFVLKATGADPDGKVTKYEWDLDGNGYYETSTGTEPQVAATVNQKGPAAFKVRVSDDEGGQAVADAALIFKDAPCIANPVIKAAKARITTQGADVAGGAGCFHGVTTNKPGSRTTVYTTSGHFKVNGLEVDTKGATEAKLTWTRKTKVNPKGGALVDSETTDLRLQAPNVHVSGTAQKTDFAFRDGKIDWSLEGDAVAGFTVDPNAGIGGLPLKVVSKALLFADGTSTLDVLPGAPPELLGKTPSKPMHLTFGPVGSAAALGAFSFTIDEIPLGVIVLGPVKVSYDGAGTWLMEAQATIPYPVPSLVKGKLVIVNGRVKSVDLELAGAVPVPPIVINALGVHIDFGPKVAANPDCIKHVGKEETTPYENYASLDYWAPFLRPIAVANPNMSPLFRKTYQDYPVPSFALCGHLALSIANLLEGDVKFGFARYANPYPNLFFFRGKVTLIKLIDAQVGAEFTTDGYVHLDAAVQGGYPKVDPWVKWDIGMDFEYYKKQFNAQAYARIEIVPLDFVAGAEILVSNKGMAACLYFKAFGSTWKPGAGAIWGKSPTLYLFGCDVKDYKVVIKHALSGDTVIGDIAPQGGKIEPRAAGDRGLPVTDRLPDGGHGNAAGLMRLAGTPPSKAALRNVSAEAAQAGPDPIDIPAGLPGTVMGFVGAGAPPHVVLNGPKGERFDTGSGNAAVQLPGFAALKNAKTGITEVVIPTPSAGRWTVEVAADSSRLVQAIQADGTRGPTVTGKVTGSGQDRRLAYSVKGLPAGGRIDLVEAGEGAGAKLGSVKADGSGTLPFHPAIGQPGKRAIQGIVYAADGYLSARLALGTYTAPAPARPGRATKLTLRRVGSRLVLRWKGDRLADSYQVDVRSSKGLNVTRTVKRTTAWIPMPTKGSRLRLRITPSTLGGLTGPATSSSRALPDRKQVRKPQRRG